MNKNKLIKIIYMCIFLGNSAIFSSQLTNWIKNVLNSVKYRFFKKTPHQELCEKNLEIIANHTLDDVYGMEDIKTELDNIIKHFCAKPTNKIKKLHVFLLHGWARAGKTFVINGFIGSLQQKMKKSGKNIKALEVPPSLISRYGVSSVLKYIKKQAPTVIYIDEIELFAWMCNANKDALNDFIHGVKILSNELTEPIIFFCVTNKMENVDILLSPETRKLFKIVHCEWPNFAERKIYFEREFKKFNLNPADFDLNFLAEACKDCPYEKINYVLGTALMQAQLKGVPLSQNILQKIIEQESKPRFLVRET